MGINQYLAGTQTGNAVHFGKKNQSKATPKGEYNGVMQTLQGKMAQLWQLFKKGVLGLLRGIEIGYDQLKMTVTISLGLMTFLPLPQRLRQYIESKFLFGPIKASNVSLIKDPQLRKKIIDSTFDMTQFQPELNSSGLKLKFPQDGVRLSVWHIKAQNGMPTVVFSHGRGGNNSHQEHVMKALTQKGYGVVIYDYPGFGQSSGYPTEPGLLKSSLATSLYVQKELKIPISQQILMGTSLGSMVVTDTVRRLEKTPSLCENGKQPMALILTSTFPSLKEAFIYKRNRFFKPLRHIFNENKLTLHLDTLDSLKQIRQTPILMLQGDKDKDTPVYMARNMAQQIHPFLRPKCVLHTLKNSPHRLRDKAYLQITSEMTAFLKDRGYRLPRITGN